MREGRIALAQALAADTVTATATTGSTTSRLALASGAASFERGDIVNLTGSGATAANSKRVVQITAVDASLQLLDFYPAMTIAPASGDQVRKGWREWAAAPGSAPLDQWIYTGPLYGEHPAFAQLRAGPVPEVVGVIVPQNQTRLVAALDVDEIRLRLLGAFLEWVEGAAYRVRQLLHANPAALTMRAETCYRLTVGSITMPSREDELIERVLPIAPELAPVFV